MPTYQYHCSSCGSDLEIRQSFSEASLTVCPECSGSLRKVFNAVGVVFKGSGFYKTDSRSGSASIPATSSGTSTPSTGSDTSSTPATTPASTPAPAAAASTTD